MTTQELERTCSFRGAPCRDGGLKDAVEIEPPRRRRGWGFAAMLLALAAGVIFCHGCHRGDHDDEPAIMWLKARPHPQR